MISEIVAVVIFVGITVLHYVMSPPTCPHCKGFGDLFPKDTSEPIVPCPVCQGRGYLL